MTLRTNSAGLNLRIGQTFKIPRGPQKDLKDLLLEKSSILAALGVGTAGSLACCGFTYWLSTHVFHCPEWAVQCHVSPAVKLLASNLGLVQGIISTLYDLFLFTTACAAYLIAETSLWPAMTEQTFTFPQIDRFLAHVRGDLPSFPSALYHARSPIFFAIVLLVGLLTALLQISSTIVGWAYTLDQVPTRLLSNHTIGGGIGFSYSPSNPPGPMPQAIGSAYNLYSAWSTGQSSEPLPELRHFILDRSNLSSIGEFSVRAVETHKRINCSAQPIELIGKLRVEDPNYFNQYYTVNTSSMGYVQLRPQTQLTLWVDQIQYPSDSRAITRIVFAALGGHIDGGYHNALNGSLDYFCVDYCWTQDSVCCSSISTLACDVDIELCDSLACKGECHDTNATLTSIETLRTRIGGAFYPLPKHTSEIAAYMAAAPTLFGLSVYGRQPLFSPGTKHPGSPYALPQSWTNWDYARTNSTTWTQRNLTNFLSVAAGAVGNALPTQNQLSVSPNITVESVLLMPRLVKERSIILLVFPLFSLGCVGMLALLSAVMYRSSGLQEARLGTTGDIVINTQAGDVRKVVEDIRAGVKQKSALERLRLRYGRVADGFDGLSPSARAGAQISTPKDSASR